MPKRDAEGSALKRLGREDVGAEKNRERLGTTKKAAARF